MSDNCVSHLNKKSHPWAGETICFGTKHEKDLILAPLFNEIGMRCESLLVDTDLFGTFSGEVERIGSVRDTLKKKVKAASDSKPQGNIFLASEGSFAPHPVIGFIQTDLESLLIWHKNLNIEIYAEYLCQNPVHDERSLGPRDNFREFLKQIKFPEHGVIVHPDGMLNPIFKGLHQEHDVAQAMLDCFQASTNQRVVIATDLRANHSPTRRQAILEAGKALFDKLNSFCPACALPGFAISRGLAGLPCGACGEATRITKDVVWECVKCAYSITKPRPDGKTQIEPNECEHCNP
jgi:hypothetical protein